MQNDPHGELRNDTMFHISRMTGSAVFFSGLAASASEGDDAGFECYFLAVLQLLLSTGDPAAHIFACGSGQDAFTAYGKSAAYLQDYGLLKDGTLRVVFENIAGMVMGTEGSDETERLALVHSLASEAGFSIPETIDIINGQRIEIEDTTDTDVCDTSGVDRILPNSDGFLEKFRMLYAIECETEMDNMKALEKATEKFSRFVLGNADDVFHAIRASENP